MTSLEPQAGDVLLVIPPTDKNGRTSDPISRAIQIFTASPYSHTVLTIGPNSYAEANIAPVGHPDIICFGSAKLQDERSQGSVFHLYRAAEAVEEASLRAAVERYLQRATGPDPEVIFADGAALALALLRYLPALATALPTDERIPRLRSATFWVSEKHGDRRLFCSEFAYRVLRYADRTPAEPLVPVVPIDNVTGLEPDELLNKIWLWVVDMLDLDEDSQQSIQETWDAVRSAYDDERTPTSLDLANYFTPEDFRRSAPYRHIATLGGSDQEWTPACTTG